MQEGKTFYLFVKGQKVEVSEKVYRAYVQPERRQRMREYRAKEKISVTSIEALSEKGFEPEDETQDFESAIIGNEEHVEEISKLHAALEQLSKRDRQVICLYYFEGKTHKEIADILGLARTTVTELIPRILERIKKFL